MTTCSETLQILPRVAGLARAAATPVRAGVLIALALALALGCPAAADSWRIAEPGYAWSFPEDHWAHEHYRTEWWYFTGHLTPKGETEPRFGYQFTFFKVGLSPDSLAFDSAWRAGDLIMGHASVSDLATERHLFSDVLHRASPLLGGFGIYPDSLLAWCLAPAGTDARWTLRWNGGGFDFSMRDDAREIAFTLSTMPEKPRVFQGPGGYSRKGRDASQASLYYSYTRLRTTGSLSVDGRTFEVHGLSWMDKEIGSNQLGENQVGWDWFSLQLDDGRELMLYELREATGRVDHARGTLVSRAGEPRYLDAGDWTLDVHGEWTSPVSGATYPSGWTIALPAEGLTLRVVPELAAQENVSTRSSGIAYWEGAVEVLRDGETFGRGYVELTGYGEDDRPRL